MDEIISQFKSAAVNPENKESLKFEELYKNWGKLGHQEQRRRDILVSQRTNRHSKVDTCRGILDLISQLKEEEDSLPLREDKTSKYRPTIYVSGFTKTSTSYRNVLMMSEWMVERPEDFSSNWYVIPCPKGIRTLLVAHNGTTKFYTKYGQFRLACQTALPGGNSTAHRSHCVVLDCFHVEATNTIYALDLLAWNSQPMSDGETDFRHYWMKTHLEDIPELTTISSKNKILFEILPKVDCEKNPFNALMNTLPIFKNNTPVLDGLLFYHKMAHYVSGVTPLVGWLYPYMVNEVLGEDITVNPGYLVNRPLGYVNQSTFIKVYETKLEKKLAKSGVSMDTSSEGDATRSETKGRQYKYKNQRSSTDAEMADGAEAIGWQPTTTTFTEWPIIDTFDISLNKIRPLGEETG